MEIKNDTKQETATENPDLSQEVAPRSPFEQKLFELGIEDDPLQAQRMKFPKRPFLERLQDSLGLGSERATETMTDLSKE